MRFNDVDIDVDCSSIDIASPNKVDNSQRKLIRTMEIMELDNFLTLIAMKDKIPYDVRV